MLVKNTNIGEWEHQQGQKNRPLRKSILSLFQLPQCLSGKEILHNCIKWLPQKAQKKQRNQIEDSLFYHRAIVEDIYLGGVTLNRT